MKTSDPYYVEPCQQNENSKPKAILKIAAGVASLAISVFSLVSGIVGMFAGVVVLNDASEDANETAVKITQQLEADFQQKLAAGEMTIEQYTQSIKELQTKTNSEILEIGESSVVVSQDVKTEISSIQQTDALGGKILGIGTAVAAVGAVATYGCMVSSGPERLIHSGVRDIKGKNSAQLQAGKEMSSKN